VLSGGKIWHSDGSLRFLLMYHGRRWQISPVVTRKKQLPILVAGCSASVELALGLFVKIVATHEKDDEQPLIQAVKEL